MTQPLSWLIDMLFKDHTPIILVLLFGICLDINVHVIISKWKSLKEDLV